MSTHIFNCLYAGLYAGEGIVSDFMYTQKVTGNNDGQAVSFYCCLVRGSLFIELGCMRDLGKGWRGDLGTFMISRSI